jgi:hypothetical protein
MSNLNINNIATSSEHLYLKQQQQLQNSHTYKLDNVSSLADEHLYKRLFNYYPNLSNLQQFVSNNNFNNNNGISLNDQRLDTTHIKMLSTCSNIGNGKSSEKQVLSPIGYSRNLAAVISATREDKKLQEFNFNDQNPNYRHFVVNKANTFKAFQQQNTQVSELCLKSDLKKFDYLFSFFN